MTHRKPLQIFIAVQRALFFRELGARLSEGRAGLFWTFFEPFIQVMIFVLVKVALFGRNNSGFDYAVFITVNFIAFNMFKHILTKSSLVFKANKPLFLYKQIKPIDTVIARVAIEVFLTGIIIILFLILGLYLQIDMQIKNLNMVAFGFFALMIFSFACALLNATLSLFFPSIAKVIGFSIIALMFGSAVMFTIDMTPQVFASFILMNPLTHFMEIIHGYYFYALDDKYVDYQYILLWTLSLLVISLWLYRVLEKRIISK